jgi:hypothetical protein
MDTFATLIYCGGIIAAYDAGYNFWHALFWGFYLGKHIFTAFT